jgi:hypothetical protein
MTRLKTCTCWPIRRPELRKAVYLALAVSVRHLAWTYAWWPSGHTLPTPILSCASPFQQRRAIA